MLETRPLLTFALITYNQASLVAEAVRGALAQTYTPLEIILSDDCSPDDTFQIMHAMAAYYNGPHTVIVRQTPKNLGLVGHINNIMEMARGEVVVIAAGDDISMPQRTTRIYDSYLKSGKQAHSIFSNATWVDETGQALNLLHKTPVPLQDLTLEKYATRPGLALVNGATHAWRKATFDFFGPLPPEVCAEDLTIPFRSALLGTIAYIHEPLVYYRRDAGRLNITRGMAAFGEHRRKWLKWKRAHANVYACRLRDLAHFTTQRSNTPALESIRRGMQAQLDRLNTEIVAAQGIPQKPLRGRAAHLRLWLASYWEPLKEFIVLIVYYLYQNLRRHARPG